MAEVITARPAGTFHHVVKCHPGWFQELVDGTKTWEVRKNDRSGGYEPGDVMTLREFDPADKTYSGRELRVLITGVKKPHPSLEAWGLRIRPGFVLLSFQQC